MNKFRKVFLTAFFMTLGFYSYSQMGVTGYSIYSFGINTNQNKTFTGELKTFANRNVEGLLMETAFHYNFKPGPYHRVSVGLGLNFAPFRGFDQMNAFTIPAQLEIFPLQEFKKLSLLFELAPEFFVESDVVLRNLWGIRYTFGPLES